MLLRLLKTSSFKPAASSRRPPPRLVLAIRLHPSLNRSAVAVEPTGTGAGACLSLPGAVIVAATIVVLECVRVLVRDTGVDSSPAGREVPAISI